MVSQSKFGWHRPPEMTGLKTRSKRLPQKHYLMGDNGLTLEVTD